MKQRQLIVRSDAELDITEASEWYESQRKGLGLEFIEAVNEGLDLIRQFPQGCQVVYKNARRLVCADFHI